MPSAAPSFALIRGQESHGETLRRLALLGGETHACLPCGPAVPGQVTELRSGDQGERQGADSIPSPPPPRPAGQRRAHRSTCKAGSHVDRIHPATHSHAQTEDASLVAHPHRLGAYIPDDRARHPQKRQRPPPCRDLRLLVIPQSRSPAVWSFSRFWSDLVFEPRYRSRSRPRGLSASPATRLMILWFNGLPLFRRPSEETIIIVGFDSLLESPLWKGLRRKPCSTLFRAARQPGHSRTTAGPRSSSRKKVKGLCLSRAP